MSAAGTPSVASAHATSHFTAHIGVRWSDLDAFNHVNNASYLTYLEESRLQWMQTLRGWHDEHAMPVLAASVLNYRQPIAWPAALHVELSCTRAGRTSVTLAHRIVAADDATRLYCDGHVVMVWVDPANGQAVALPAAIRAAAAAMTAS